MLARLPRPPFSLDPLVAEAKRRARQRRLLVAGALALIVAGVVGGVFASRSPGGPGAASSTAAAAASGRGRGRVGLVEAKGPAFPVRTFVLALRNDRRLTVGEVKVTENGRSVIDPTLIPARQASEDRTLSNEYLLQYKSLVGPDKTIRVLVKVKGAGTVVAGYTSPALRVRAAPITAHKPLVAPAANQLPPLSNLAARAMWCGDAYNASGHGGCHSPDGKWAIVVKNQGKGCTLVVTRTSTGRVERVGQSGSWGCAPDLWVGRAFVVQEGFDEPQHRVVSLAPPSRHVKVLARFRSMVVSPNKHWIAGEAVLRSDGTPQLIAVVSLTSHTCRVVTRATSPTQDVSVDKSPWSIRPVDPTTPFQNPVVWRTIVRGGKKIRVVSGPGTGFTRNSRSVIVAKWQSSQTAPYATDKRLVKFNLSSLRTPCPSGLAPSS